jgi:hypothetical protein
MHLEVVVKHPTFPNQSDLMELWRIWHYKETISSTRYDAFIKNKYSLSPRNKNNKGICVRDSTQIKEEFPRKCSKCVGDL